MNTYYRDVEGGINAALEDLRMWGSIVDPGRWQGVPTEGKPDLVTKELLDLRLAFDMPATVDEAVNKIHPNMPWAEDHFQERVSRVPSNPGEQYKDWPWWQGQTLAFDQPLQGSVITEVFSHTYQERFWPKWAGWTDVEGEPVHKDEFASEPPNKGIRYQYGDLDDVVNQLFEEPFGRQAYFPIFFPEDTGAVHGGRVPCTLGYHFMLRDRRLFCWYDIRSCDAVRHFRDDLYLATRLVQWVIAELVEKELRSDKEQIWVDVNPGIMYFCAHSFHVHMGDYHLLKTHA